jgi:hypothetical protein
LVRARQSVSYSLSSREVEAVLMTLYDLYCAPRARSERVGAEREPAS